MKTLREIIKEAEERGVAIGHFNVADFAMIKGIVSVFQKGKENFLGLDKLRILLRAFAKIMELIFFSMPTTRILLKK